VMTLILPVTVLVLRLMRFFNVYGLHPDVLGLSAISVGIVGILVFFMFLYKYQIHSGMTAHRRWVALLIHGMMIIVLFLLVILFGFIWEVGKIDMWGNYSLEIASRSWVIAVLVVGTITLLGSFFDLIGYSSRVTSQKDAPEDAGQH
jgi:hypothetical protein